MGEKLGGKFTEYQTDIYETGDRRKASVSNKPNTSVEVTQFGKIARIPLDHSMPYNNVIYTATKNISLALYRYMCQNIVGSENHVNTLRLMNTVRDNIQSGGIITYITSGSFGEGLEMRGSDLDIMRVIKSMEVHEDIKTAYNSNVTHLSMETDDVKAGFTQLLVEQIYPQFLCKYCEELNGKHYFSSALYMEEFMVITNSVKHGPCLSDKAGIYDNAICLHCATWISQASQWITRSSNSWPSYDVKQNQFSYFHVSMWMNKIKPHTLHTIEFAKISNSKVLYLANNIANVNEQATYTYKRGIHQIVSRYQSPVKYLCTYHLSLFCRQYAQCIPLHSTRSSNKHQYKQYKSCLCTLLQNIYHDAVSGWLMIASFFYKTKEYSKALHIIIYSMSKCTPEKLHRFIDINFQLPEFHLNHRKSVVQMWKILLVDVMKFKRNSLLIPNELQMELGSGVCLISPVVYAYFLKFLCHYYLNNVRQC
ncbi:unnamed protein product [Mytilus coruscus]|uniref:Uncharacterized protein n=1 Tax=Mytilus coruscus TaxID=42192 RepID=A0A6J8ESG7_MYTCO|nr:unnamed protein product [Mytilus coruscus]